tara:strand:- start:71 stop:250 length:180 start_codon:yes stop_codon:yes gene_type:complete
MSDDIEVWKQRNEILHKKVERLMEELRQEHKLRQEVEEDNKKLALQVSELEDRIRDSNF